MRRTLRADRINSRPVARQRGHAIQLQVSPASRDGCPLCFWRIQYGSPSWLIQNVLEIDRKVLIARVLLFLLALIIGLYIVDRLFLRNETRRLHHRAPALQVGTDGGGELVGRLKLGVVADSGEAFDHLG